MFIFIYFVDIVGIMKINLGIMSFKFIIFEMLIDDLGY